MCGIVGIYNFDKKRVVPGEIKKMADAIKHRGPDSEGFWIKDNVGLGHRRLAILDLSQKGGQPVSNENNSIISVCNGEIYNFKKLKKELLKKGHKFKSNSDSEIIVHLYEEYGTESFSRLEGMFALVIWDRKKSNLIFARDRLGIKPLYYYFDNQKVVFSSEIKGLLSLPGIKKKINLKAINHYFFSNQIFSPETSFKNIVSILPAEYIVFSENGKKLRKKYWQLVFQENNTDNDKVVSKNFLKLLENSVKSNLMSDRPIGIALSGGIDSSILTALVSKNYPKKIKTFSFNFSGDTKIKRNDFQMANYISKLFKTDHNNFVLKPDDLLNSLENIVWSLEMPVNTFAFDYYICQRCSKGKIKTLLTGDGSEELLGKYWNHRLAQSMSHILEYLKNKKEYSSLERKFIKNYITITAERSWQFSGLYSFEEKDKSKLYSNYLFKKSKDFSVYKDSIDVFKQNTAKNFYNKILEIDNNNFLINHTLAIVDKVSMANSVEIRPPFLDYHLVEYVASLPARMKSRAGITKFILKEAAKEIFPEKIISKFKSGVTGPPISNWLISDLESYVKKVLSTKNIKKHGFFNETYVSSLIKEYYSFKNIHKPEGDYFFKYSKENHMAKIWKLLMFQLWWEKYFR